MNVNFKALHEKAVQLTQNYLRAESELISVLQEIDECKGYREFGYKSLFEYATQSLRLSESVSFNFIAVARKSREVPRLQEMIQKQEITLSNARTIAPVLTPANQEKWLSAAATLSKRSLEKEIAHEFPGRQVQERTRFVSEDRIELKLGISKEINDLLQRAQDLLSSQTQKHASLEDTLKAALELYIERKDPQKKAERFDTRESLSKKTPNTSPVPGQVKAQNPRLIPAKLEHLVRLRDQGRCTFLAPTGNRCAEKRWLEIHHIQPLSKGGETRLDNLTLLCRGHHQLAHHQMRKIESENRNSELEWAV